MNVKNIVKGAVALSPIALLLTVYLVGSIVAGDFYKIPISAAFVVAAIYAIAVMPGGNTLEERNKSYRHCGGIHCR